MSLSNIKCPNCKELLIPKNQNRVKTTSYYDCLRRCEKCEIGISNSKSKPTIIYKKYYENVPKALRQDLNFSLENALNILNRKNKINKFGFSTSEDALTWSFFKYFVVSNKYIELLKILNIESNETIFDIYLWGVNICTLNKNSVFLNQLVNVSDSFNEFSSRRTEPDVIIKLHNKLIFIEVKYLSSNELRVDKEIFKKYTVPEVNLNDIAESGHYELFRNWAFLSMMSKEEDFELINLGLEKLFIDKNKDKLLKFESSLYSKNGNFRKLSWEDVLQNVNNLVNDYWFIEYLTEKINASH
ncbi:MAG: hypothetical protein ACK413_03080 [Patescibacteria group bacterium]